MNENNILGLPEIQATSTLDPETGRSTIAWNEGEETGDGTLHMHRSAAGSYAVTPWDEDRRQANETYLMSKGIDPSFASSPWFVDRVREENGDE